MEKYLTIIFFIVFSCFCNAQIDRFKIQKTNNSYKLISPTGNSFFSLGITHTQALNYPNSMKIFVNKYKNDWSLASAEIYRNLISWEFNTAGYGAPKELRKLIPFMMPSQPLVENSSWLEKEKFSLSDIFDTTIRK